MDTSLSSSSLYFVYLSDRPQTREEHKPFEIKSSTPNDLSQPQNPKTFTSQREISPFTAPYGRSKP
ncbi:hypothetical protein NC652_008301 [Populus alba x Populus x berolinensis]|uniref:Uncharacterized protein n=1 Tax=Populus alba x Populus x berolinensis TaxID=444605 RepID=A0AAD6R6H3_9ROSI|nr:hypothetical protein NC652_008301 [Populus alba x Populus x berolinensis]KAJ7003047.1 hypothetical protein NC653_008321 [Populus alba x Populus x berolinensis]